MPSFDTHILWSWNGGDIERVEWRKIRVLIQMRGIKECDFIRKTKRLLLFELYDSFDYISIER